MIIGLSLILAGFIWLLIETNFLRVRLPVGEPEKVKRITWEDLKSQYLNKLPEKQTPKWYTSPETYPPICGQSWLESTMHVIPEYKFQLSAYGVKHRITLNVPNEKVIREIATIAFKPNTEQRKELRAKNKLAQGVK